MKKGFPIIFLRNLYSKSGIYNGTKIVVVKLAKYIIKGKILSGSFTGQIRIIPRITLAISNK